MRNHSHLQRTSGITNQGLAGFNRYYDLYRQAVYANILKMVHHREVAEDILQEVFVALWERLEQIEPERAGNWLFVVSYNKALTYLKRQRLAVFVPMVPGVTSEAVEELAEINEAEFELKLRMIEEAVGLLPGRKKEIFVRYRMQGMTLEEIAAELQLSVNTVKDHLKVANRMIREQLKTGVADASVYTLVLFFTQV